MFQNEWEGKFPVRTDLALEAREDLGEEAEAIEGVRFWEEEKGGGVRLSGVVVENEAGAKRIGKPAGRYLTIEAEALRENDGGSHREVSLVLAEELRELLPGKAEDLSVLVAGLGNAAATPDSLGPKVVENLCVTRRLIRGGRISSIAPGVMAQTGMEAAEIIRGIIRETTPDAVICVDALAARSVSRLGNTVQLADTGIRPGSGVGNHRMGLTKESLGVPVIALGVPTVVAAPAIVCDTVDAFIEVLASWPETKSAAGVLARLSEEERYSFIREIFEPRFGPMYVTPKNVDDTVERISYTISEGINAALLGENAFV